MIADVRKQAHSVPFVAFTIHLGDGGRLRMSTVSQVAASPTGGRVIALADDDTQDVISGLVIRRIAVDRRPTSRSQSS